MMKVIDILEVTNESTNVNLIDCNSKEVLSYYDGKNSIDTIYNDWKVERIYTSNNDLMIEIFN